METWTKQEQALLDNAIAAARLRWEKLLKDPNIVLAEDTGSDLQPRIEQPKGSEDYDKLRIGRSDFAWISAKDPAIAEKWGGKPVLPGTPKAERRTSVTSFLEAVINKKTAFEKAAEAGWTLVEFPHWKGTNNVLELRNAEPNNVRLSTCFAGSHWDLGGFGNPVATADPLISPSTAPGTGQGTTVFVADSGLLIQFFSTTTQPIKAEDGADLVAFPVTPEDWHGGFVAKIVSSLAPNSTILVGDVMGASRVVVWEIDAIAELVEDALRTRSDAAAAHQINPKHIINCSFGGVEDGGPCGLPIGILDLVLSALLTATNTVLVASAGNQGIQNTNYRPAGFKHPRLISVGAVVEDTSPTPVRASFSNFGHPRQVYALGVNVVSETVPGTKLAWSGTSFAAPIVSARLAQLMETMTATDAVHTITGVAANATIPVATTTVVRH